MKYNVIYADPAWEYNQKSAGRGNKSGARDKYKTMSIEDIQNLPVRDIVLDDAVLFMWATVPLLPEALSVIPAWGFKYKTIIIWEKTGLLGMGNWVRIQEEILIVAVRGKVKPFGNQSKNIYRHAICDHSAKPHFFRELVSKLAAKSFGNDITKLEMFARSRSGMFSDYEYEEGWDVWGKEVNNSININNIRA
jgi:site-specific DNA-methyltransferase (adenine-specific)